MEPIPLRTLTTLLNYERMISDPRYKDMALQQSSVADDEVPPRFLANYSKHLTNEPKTIEKREFHIFKEHKPIQSNDPAAIICHIHPEAGPKVQVLTFADRERIYLETRAHDGCFKAIGLFQFFFELCPAGQQLSVQIRDEEPLLIDPKRRMILKSRIEGPKVHTIAWLSEKSLTFPTGSKDNEDHAIIIFKRPDSTEVGDDIVVDMTRTQYGPEGRGTFGEPYFIGTANEFSKSMRKICDTVVVVNYGSTDLGSSGNDNEKRLRDCAKKVWERWQNRKNEHWCAYCGKPGEKLLKCGGCKTKIVWYCCKEYQVADRKLHKHTCEMKTKTT